VFLGIDPGASGGIAVLSLDHVLETWKMPDTEGDIAELIDSLAPRITFCLIEAVHSLPKQGVSSTFAFGRNYGFLRGRLIGKIPFEEIPPGKWQAQMGVKPIKDEPKTAHKNRLKAKAQQLFPHHKMTHAIADAALIAEYTYRSRISMIPKQRKPAMARH
jgi:hypothetical protein